MQARCIVLDMVNTGYRPSEGSDLFGHSLNRERYGKGATLEHLHQCVQSVALWRAIFLARSIVSPLASRKARSFSSLSKIGR